MSNGSNSQNGALAVFVMSVGVVVLLAVAYLVDPVYMGIACLPGVLIVAFGSKRLAAYFDRCDRMEHLERQLRAAEKAIPDAEFEECVPTPRNPGTAMVRSAMQMYARTPYGLQLAAPVEPGIRLYLKA